ncbi:hypothetical protein P43SY_003241 [Pythium insidiosum]|uniref:Uncharacterized protein n=1 Tax=Pythium insidiosum TaxID=114742 RepID=A0AAD5LE92_PYTIN|nr:hypothetical protein P43SY_003241 [Pythium insidiosum]
MRERETMWRTRLLALEEDMRAVKRQLTQLTTSLVDRLVVEAPARSPPPPVTRTHSLGADEIRRLVVDALDQALRTRAETKKKNERAVATVSDTSDSEEDVQKCGRLEDTVALAPCAGDIEAELGAVATDNSLFEITTVQVKPREHVAIAQDTEELTLPGCLPEGFEIETKDPLSVAWKKWCCGDAELGIPPLRAIRRADLPSKSSQRRLSDLRCAMLPIEALARQRFLWTDTLTAQQADDIFQSLQQDDLEALGLIPSRRPRKREVAWSTALNAMRRHKKRKLQLECDVV